MTTVNKTTNPTTVAPPSFSEDVIAEAVARNYKLHGEYTQLVSERDQNLKLRTPDGQRFVVKVTGLLEDRIATDFQIALLSHFEENGFNFAPRVVTTTSGEKRSTITAESGQEYCLRIVTWLDGQLLQDSGLTTSIANRFGQRLAELDRSLEGFEFDGDGQAGLWDMQAAPQLRQLLHHIDDEVVQECAAEVLTRFEETVASALQSLPRQAIHNDANPENILIGNDDDVSGFIDFGDALKAPRIIDVATAASYLRTGGKNPMKHIEAFIDGYHQQSPMSDTEFALLFDLIRTRLTTTLVIMYWRLAARDEDDPYRQKTLESEGDAFEFLAFLSHLGHDTFNSRINKLIQKSRV